MRPIYRSEAGREALEARYREFLAAWPVANRQFHVPTRAGETFIVACGPEDAPPVLLLHGSAANSFTWMGDVADWAEHLRLYAVDMIGEPGLSAPSRPLLASNAYVEWLDDVLAALGLEKTALAGISLGGWLALDYATRRPDRVTKLALLCPGGVGRHKTVLWWALPLMLLGRWGRRRVMRIIAGPPLAGASPPNPEAADFLTLIHRNFRPRMERLPVFSDTALAQLTMPVLAILGGRDVMIDSPGTRRRLEALVPQARILWLSDAGHFLLGQTAVIRDFLIA